MDDKDANLMTPGKAFVPMCQGGSGSGNFGHEGRPGEVGGSGDGGGVPANLISHTRFQGVAKAELDKHLISRGASPATVKEIDQTFDSHKWGGEGQQKADQKLASWYNDPNSEHGAALREISKVEWENALEQERLERESIKTEIDRLDSLAPGKITESNRSDAMQLSGREEWYYDPIREPEDYKDYWQGRRDAEQKKYDQGLMLYRRSSGADTPQDRSNTIFTSIAPSDKEKGVLAFTTREEGARPSIVSNPDETISPNTHISLHDLQKEGYSVLGGFATIRGYTAESEVIMVKRKD